MSRHQELRDRTAREMGLAGNHWEAIQKHLDAYEAAYAHELAEKIRNNPRYDLTKDQAAALIDPRSESE